MVYVVHEDWHSVSIGQQYWCICWMISLSIRVWFCIYIYLYCWLRVCVCMDVFVWARVMNEVQDPGCPCACTCQCRLSSDTGLIKMFETDMMRSWTRWRWGRRCNWCLYSCISFECFVVMLFIIDALFRKNDHWNSILNTCVTCVCLQ